MVCLCTRNGNRSNTVLFIQVKQIDYSMTWGRVILSIIAFFVGIGCVMMVLEHLPIEVLLGLLLTMFVVGFAIPQKKCVPCDIQPVESPTQDCFDRSG